MSEIKTQVFTLSDVLACVSLHCTDQKQHPNRDFLTKSFTPPHSDQLTLLLLVMNNERWKKCMFFRFDTDTVEVSVYPYQNIVYLKYPDIKMSVLECKHNVRKRNYILSHLQTYIKKCIVIVEKNLGR